MDGVTEVERLRADVAARGAEIATRDARIAELEEQVGEVLGAGGELAKLRELLGRNSSNSNLPPSSDPPGGAGKTTTRKKRKKRRRRGQKGHRGSHRALLSSEQMDEVVDVFPPECESCWEALPRAVDPFAKRYQHTELGALSAHRTEYRRHAVVCRCCGYKTRAAYDPELIPRSVFGPRLMAVVAMLTGVYHLSRRQTVRLLWGLLGVRVLLGTVSAIEKRVSESVRASVDEAWDKARSSQVKHTDGTSWLQAGVMLSLWTVATTAATVLKIVANGQRETLKKLFVTFRGVLVSDRATALTFWAMKRRQVCRVGGGLSAPAPHRSGRAGFPHPVPHMSGSLVQAYP